MRRRIWRLFLDMFTSADARRFIIGVLIAFLPAMVIGALAYSTIKSALFNVWIVCATLIIGGVVLLVIDRLNLKPRYHDATEFSLPMYLGIGVIQCLSMIPGVSRSGATIVGAMLFGADKRAATEFSFWLAMPTMVGAFVFEAYKSRAEFAGGKMWIIAIGFAVSFVCGWFVVKTLLGYVSRHGFALFAWWRIGGRRARAYRAGDGARWAGADIEQTIVDPAGEGVEHVVQHLRIVAAAARRNVKGMIGVSE